MRNWCYLCPCKRTVPGRASGPNKPGSGAPSCVHATELVSTPTVQHMAHLTPYTQLGRRGWGFCRRPAGARPRPAGRSTGHSCRHSGHQVPLWCRTAWWCKSPDLWRQPRRQWGCRRPARRGARQLTAWQTHRALSMRRCVWTRSSLRFAVAMLRNTLYTLSTALSHKLGTHSLSMESQLLCLAGRISNSKSRQAVAKLQLALLLQPTCTTICA